MSNIKQELVEEWWELLEKKNKYERKIEDINTKILSIKDSIKNLNLKDGQYICKDYIVDIETKESKGKATPSWKTIAQDLSNSTADITTVLIHDGYNKKTADKYSQLIIAEYNKLLTKHTKVGESKINTDLNISKAKK